MSKYLFENNTLCLDCKNKNDIGQIEVDYYLGLLFRNLCLLKLIIPYYLISYFHASTVGPSSYCICFS